SPDGRSWTEARPPEGTAQALRAVAADGAGAVVAVGDDVVLHRPGAGADWVERTVPNNAPFGYQLQDVTWTGTQWVAVGSGNMVSASPDGVTWTTLSEGDHVTDDYWAVAAGRGRLVTGGGSTTLIHSDDGGSSFTPAAYAGRSNFQAPAELLFEDGFVALASVFSDTQMYASDDGETWESARTLRGDPEYISRLAALPLDGGPVYLAAGYFAGLNRGGAFLGTERRNWEGGPFAFSTGDLAGLAAGGGIFLAVSDRGELQASLNGRHWEPAPDGFVSQAIAESGFTDLVHDGEAFIGVTLSGRIVRLAVAARSALPESARFHLEAVWQAGALHLRWTADDARLVTSSDLAPGSWTEVEGATSPWPIYAMPVRPAFYRLEGDGVEPDGAAP
ncbi:MAG: WD40/YVTN/BNR-like repeat-containing protein, partial [Verrucomicrobiota bacterium]